MMKTCTKCNLEFPKSLKYFSKNGKSLRPDCKSCESARSKAYYSLNSEKIKIIAKSYQKDNSDKIKKASKIYRDSNKDKLKAKAKIYNAANSEKQKAKSKAWHLANLEKAKADAKAWNLAHPGYSAAANRKRDALIKNNGHSAYTEQQVLETYGIDCNICNLPIDLNTARQIGKPGWQNGLHIDHLIPISKGGPDTLENVRPTHGLCNITKNNKEQYEVQMA
jgi:hypothetical protein